MSTAAMFFVPQVRPLAEVVNIVSGFGFPKELQGKLDGDLPFFKVGDISIAWNNGQKNLTQAQHYLDHAEANSIRANAFPKGTVVFAKIGEAIRLNRRAILGQPSLVDNNVMGLIPKEEVVDSIYLFYWSLMLRLGDISQATTVPSVRKSDVEQLSFPWLPLDQQKRIVAEIEKQFSRLDEAVANLKRVKANLKRYKAAVLKVAVEGRLVETEAEIARREGRSYETGEQLLQRILENRRKQWQGKGKYKEPAAPDTTNLPELPEGWLWATYAEIGEVTTGFTPPTSDSDNFGGEVPFFKPTDLDAGDNVVVAREYLSLKGAAKGRLLPAGSILVTCIGATIGKTGLARVDCATNQQINAVTPHGNIIDSAYMYSWTVSPLGYKQILNNASATTLPIINKSKFESLAIPLPPEAEQHRIVAEVDRYLSLANEAKAQVNANLKHAERLKQSILQSAFTGELSYGKDQ